MNATPYQKKLSRAIKQVRALLMQNNPHLRQEFAELLASELDTYLTQKD